MPDRVRIIPFDLFLVFGNVQRVDKAADHLGSIEVPLSVCVVKQLDFGAVSLLFGFRVVVFDVELLHPQNRLLGFARIHYRMVTTKLLG